MAHLGDEKVYPGSLGPGASLASAMAGVLEQGRDQIYGCTCGICSSAGLLVGNQEHRFKALDVGIVRNASPVLLLGFTLLIVVLMNELLATRRNFFLQLLQMNDNSLFLAFSFSHRETLLPI